MTDSGFILIALVAVCIGLIIAYFLLLGILAVWPLALVLAIAGYLIGGTPGVVGALLLAGVVGLIFAYSSG